MTALLSNLGSLFGLFGIALSLVAGLTRLAGTFFLAGFELRTLLLAGMGLLITGCFLKLEALSRR